MIWVAAACVGLSVSTACAAPSNTGQASSGTTPAGRPAESGVQAVIDGTGLSASDLQFVDLAEQTLTQQCLQRHGFEYTVSPEALDAVVLDVFPPEPSAAAAKAQGYGLAAESRALAPARASGDPGPGQLTPEQIAGNAYESTLTPQRRAEYQRLIVGTDASRRMFRLVGGVEVGFPTTGCGAQARLALYGGWPDYLAVTQVPQFVRLEFAGRLQRDRTYAAAARKWSVCMARSGLNYQTPGSAYADMEKRYATSGPTVQVRQLEIETAVADTRCARAVHLAQVQASAERRFEDRLSGPDQRSVLLSITALTQAKARARRLLGSR